jgi:hypothetical protein
VGRLGDRGVALEIEGEGLGSCAVGVVHPMIATRPAWWETLNSRPFMSDLVSEEDGAEESEGLGPVHSSGGSQYGRLWGAGVREIWMSDQGIPARRWMNVYLSSALASDMKRSAGRMKRVTDS